MFILGTLHIFDWYKEVNSAMDIGKLQLDYQKNDKRSYVVHVKRGEHGPNVGVWRIRQILQAKEAFEFVKGEQSRGALSHELRVPVMTLTGL